MSLLVENGLFPQPAKAAEDNSQGMMVKLRLKITICRETHIQATQKFFLKNFLLYCLHRFILPLWYGRYRYSIIAIFVLIIQV